MESYWYKRHFFCRHFICRCCCQLVGHCCGSSCCSCRGEPRRRRHRRNPPWHRRRPIPPSRYGHKSNLFIFRKHWCLMFFEPQQTVLSFSWRQIEVLKRKVIRRRERMLSDNTWNPLGTNPASSLAANYYQGLLDASRSSQLAGWPLPSPFQTAQGAYLLGVKSATLSMSRV